MHVTRSVYLWTRLLSTPFWALFALLPVILYRDFGATPLQITLLVTLKPLVALLSPYWSARIHHRPDRLIGNLALASGLKYVPFLFAPWINNAWVFVGAFGLHMMLVRAAIPGWMELCRRHMEGERRQKTFALGSAVDYLGGALLPLAFGWVLDGYLESWRWIFPLFAVVGMGSTLLFLRLPRLSLPLHRSEELVLGSELQKPWKEAWELLRGRADFRAFQWAFMLGGSGLMVLYPALPRFFVDALHLSYTELALALTVCKGVGFALTSPLWARFFGRVDLFRFTVGVTFLAALFPLCLLAAPGAHLWLYVGYMGYGVMQAGSEMAWHLSGPIFSGDAPSGPFSRANVLMVGLRGCFAPALGSLLLQVGGSFSVMALSCFLCTAATLYLLLQPARKAIPYTSV